MSQNVSRARGTSMIKVKLIMIESTMQNHNNKNQKPKFYALNVKNVLLSVDVAIYTEVPCVPFICCVLYACSW